MAAGVSAIILALSLVLKVGDLLARGAMGAVFSGVWEGKLFLLEILCATVIPIAIVAVPRFRRAPGGLATAATFAVFGILLNRVNVGIFGYFTSGGTSYAPTLQEFAVTLGIPAAAGLVFLLFTERFRVFDFAPIETDDATTEFDPQTGVWRGVLRGPVERFSLIAVVAIPVALLFFAPLAGARPDDPRPVQAPRGLDDRRETLLIDGDRAGHAVRFAHQEHIGRLGGDDSCRRCHHIDRPGDRWTACHHCHRDMTQPRSIFDHELHVDRVAARNGHTGALAGNQACAECHGASLPSSRANSKACVACHEDDMRMEPGFGSDRARGYVDALHESCVGCHDESAGAVGRPRLGECETCHE
jgi:hypothetical protein